MLKKPCLKTFLGNVLPQRSVNPQFYSHVSNCGELCQIVVIKFTDHSSPVQTGQLTLKMTPLEKYNLNKILLPMAICNTKR